MVQDVGRVLLQPYFVLHLVSLLSYFVLRYFALAAVSPLSQPTFLRWESQAVLSFLVVLVIKFVRSNTSEGFLGDALLYAKCILALLVAILDLRLLPWYLFFFAAISLLWHQPAYTGSDNVLPLTPLQLEGQLLETQTAAWLVEFGAVWSPHCNHFRRTFAELSLTYSSQTLHFGRVDVGCFPSVASKYGIEFQFTMRQLPTLVLFEGGVETARLCPVTSDGASFSRILSKSMVVQHFDLDLLLIRALSEKADAAREGLGK